MYYLWIFDNSIHRNDIWRFRRQYGYHCKYIHEMRFEINAQDLDIAQPNRWISQYDVIQCSAYKAMHFNATPSNDVYLFRVWCWSCNIYLIIDGDTKVNSVLVCLRWNSTMNDIILLKVTNVYPYQIESDWYSFLSIWYPDISITKGTSKEKLWNGVGLGGGCVLGWVVWVMGVGQAARRPGPRLHIKTVLSTYGDFHVKDKTAVRTSYL